jgi:YYY domain-containing protein
LYRHPNFGYGRAMESRAGREPPRWGRRPLTDEPLPVPGRRLSRVRRRSWLAAASLVAAAVAVAVVVSRVGSTTLVLPADRFEDQAAHGTWREMFDVDGVAAMAPVLVWVLVLVALGAVGFPYAWVAARALPDRGYALARVVGLLLVTWIVWWLASVEIVPFTRAAILLAIGVISAGAAAVAVRHRREMRQWLRTRWRFVAAAEVVFWGLFVTVLFVRWSNPDLWHETRGGEKPMDFAYLNATAKSTSFPPFDPWFAGGKMNYYYYGFVEVATLAKLTRIPPAIAYNLAIPTFAALLGAAAFAIVLGLRSQTALRARPATGVAVLGALLVAAAGNLGEIRVLRSALHGPIPIEWWFWNPTRVIRPGAGEPGPITEFPAFTFIYGDLHAHAMALPVAALALALMVSIVRTPNGEIPNAAIALLGIGLGALWVTNSWDFPTYSLLAVCAVAIGTLSPGVGRRRIAALTARLAALLLLAYLAYLPFHLQYESVFDGVARWDGTRTGLGDYLTIHGLFLFAIMSAIVVRLAVAADLGAVARAYRAGITAWDRFGRYRDLRQALVRPTRLHRVGLRAVPTAVFVALVCATTGEDVAAIGILVATLAVLAWPASRRGRDARGRQTQRLVLTFVLVGLVLTVAVEYVVLRNIDIGRVNTVFKLYLQVWLLWAVAAAVSIGAVYERLPRLRRSLREAWRLAFVALLAVAFLYPFLAARAKIGDRFAPSVGRTLDGTAFMEAAVHVESDASIPLVYDRAAIRWIQEHVDGSPIIAEVNTAPILYGWQGRYAAYTGNPAIVGWDFHERQQRPRQSGLVQERVADVQAAFATTSAATAYHLLSRYGATYVVDGPLERAYFPDATGKWAAGAGRYWTLVYANPGVRIYRIRPTASGVPRPVDIS